MGVAGFSHVAIGVTDPDRSLAFYRDVVGLTLCMDTEEKGEGPPPVHRRAIYFRWKPESIEGFIVLDHHFNHPPKSQASEMFEVGFHHIAFAVDDVEVIHKRALQSGTEVIRSPIAREGFYWGMPGDDKPAVITLLIKDPDGNIVQFDQWIGER